MKLNFSNYWFEEEKFGAHQKCYETVMAVIADQEVKYSDMRKYAVLYKDESITGFNPGEYRRSYDDFDPFVCYNVIRICTDTLTSKITMNKPAPRFLTSAGSEDLQERAKKKEKFVSAILTSKKAYEKATKAFRDSCIYGDGVLKIYSYEDEVYIENVHPSRIIVDNNACLDSPPRTMWQKTYLSKSKLLELFPKKRAEIEDAKTQMMGSLALTRDLVEVWEVWYLGNSIVPGRYMAFTETCTLRDEEWNKKEFPFCVFKFSDDLMGWNGVGIASQLEGLQVEINEVLEKIRANMNLLAVPYIIKEKGSDIHDEHLMSNKDARLLEYTNTPPQVITPPAVHPQVFQYLEQLYQRSFEIVGLSQLSSTSRKPEGLNSGVALRTFHDIETQRFSVIARKWEQFFIDISARIIDAVKDISEEGYEAKYIGSDFIQKLNFNDIAMDESDYTLQVYPASSLPQTPAGRLQNVIDLIQGGMIDPIEGRQLLDFPDLEKSSRLASASRDDLEATFEYMLSKGKYIEPLQFQDLATGIKLGVSYYLRAKMDGVKQGKLDLILRWLDEAADMLQPPQPLPEEQPLQEAPQFQPATLEGQPLPTNPSALPPLPPNLGA